MVDNRHADTTVDLLTDVFSAVDGECLLVDPSLEVLEAVGSLNPDTDLVTDACALGSPDTPQSARDDFLVRAALPHPGPAPQHPPPAHPHTRLL